MDFISHILIGRIISFNKTKIAQIWAMFFSFFPDFTQIPFFIYLGYINARPFFYPKIADWQGARALHPFLTTIYEIPHSFFFLFLIILPVILIFKLPKISFFAYFFHLFADVFTHKGGEWAMKPFYPFDYAFNGFTDAWSWPVWAFAVSWLVLISIIIILNDRSFNKN